MRNFFAGLLVLLAATGLAAAQCSTDCDRDGQVWPFDCNDWNPLISPTAVEICDGFDNDCDGLIDEAAVCSRSCPAPDGLGTDIRLTGAPAIATSPAAVWTGQGYGVTWVDSRDGDRRVYFALLDRDGARLGPDVKISTLPGGASDPSIAWTGTLFSIAYERAGHIYLSQVNAAGVLTGFEHQLTFSADSSSAPSIAWNGNEFAVAWGENLAGPNLEIFFIRVSVNGNPVGNPVRITNAVRTQYQPSLVWAGFEYGLAWYDLRHADATAPDNAEIYFARLDTVGNRLGDEVRVTNDAAFSSEPSLAWSGERYGIAWTEQRDGNTEIYFTALDSFGVTRTGDIRLTADPATSLRPSAVSTGGEFGVSWYDLRDGNAEIYFTRVGLDGTRLSPDVRLTRDPAFSCDPTVLWNGAAYAVTWNDFRSTLGEVFFLMLGCQCTDGDGDGFTSCRDCQDQRPDIHPGAADLCDGTDQNCDGIDGTDRDGDGFSTCAGDCNDGDRRINPAMVDLCDGIDNNCDGRIDETDADGDGATICNDCDDSNPKVHPGAPEICNGRDDNCNGLVDEDAAGLDTDGDRVNNACDNCPTVPNADQGDRNGDGEGDLCDFDDGYPYLSIAADRAVAWQIELGFSGYNLYRGDLALVRLRRVYTQDPGSVPLAARWCGLTGSPFQDGLAPPVGSTVFYLVSGMSGGIEGSLGTNSAGQERPNDNPCP